MIKLPPYLYRDTRAGELLELFMVSAVSALLINRFILIVSGYPSIGGSKYHIAHMLWGGLCMTIGLVLLFAFLGQRVRRLAAIVSGAGFGLFIDELGKFITRDNDYFFRPTIAFIYIIFIVMFIVFRGLSKSRQLSKDEYLMNALDRTEDAAMNDLTHYERRQILEMLKKADQDNPLTRALAEVLKSTKTVNTDDRAWLQKWIDWVVRRYRKAIRLPYAITVIEWIFIAKAFLFPLSIILGPIHFLKNGLGSDADWAVIMQFISSAVAGAYVIAGVLKIRKNRLQAYELFSKSLLVDILITQLFSFYLSQFRDLYILFINLVLYFALRFFIQQERRVAH